MPPRRQPPPPPPAFGTLAAQQVTQRPNRKSQVSMIAVERRIKRLTEQIVKLGPENVSLALVAKYHKLLAAINVEEGLLDQTIDLKQRVEWSLRISPYISMLTEGVPKHVKDPYPKVTKQVEAEISQRVERLRNIAPYLQKSSDTAAKVERILQDEAPESPAATPEETS